MRKAAYIVLLAAVVAGSFVAGAWFTRRGTGGPSETGVRKILYYVDPMHPTYKADKPGVAPDCGMELVPVYEDGSMGGVGTSASGPPGTVTISPEKQQLIGVRVAAVSRAPAAQTLRVLARVAASEDRTYRVIAGIDGWIQGAVGATTGTLVKKDQVLASFISPEAFGAQVNFISVNATGLPPGVTAIREVQGRSDITRATLLRYRGALKSLGMSDAQIDEVSRTGVPTDEIRIVAPADGIVLTRNASPGQRIEKGAELFRIANLGHVWILADVFEEEAQHLRPGNVVSVSVSTLHRTFPAKISQVLPQFDGTTRTLKVRLEADNPGFVLRPDMFVDVELPITRRPAVVVPADAVVDSGVKKIIYVAKDNGVFEPRKVETGWRVGDQVEIVKGLMPGEKIVVSGTFLIDSESRMKAAAAGIYGETSDDPVCGMEVDQGKTKAAGLTVEYKGQTYFFCSDDCKTKFAKEPAKYAWKVNTGATTPAGKRLSEVQWEGGKPKDNASAHMGHMHPPAPSAGK